MATADGKVPSSRSIRPPWPGRMRPMSLMPRSRLICDSTKSPRVAVATIVKPSRRPIQTGLLARRVADNVTAVIPKNSEPRQPLPRLVRADRGHHRMLSEQHADGIAAAVGTDHADHQAEHPAGPVRSDRPAARRKTRTAAPRRPGRRSRRRRGDSSTCGASGAVARGRLLQRQPPEHTNHSRDPDSRPGRRPHGSATSARS